MTIRGFGIPGSSNAVGRDISTMKPRSIRGMIEMASVSSFQ